MNLKQRANAELINLQPCKGMTPYELLALAKLANLHLSLWDERHIWLKGANQPMRVVLGEPYALPRGVAIESSYIAGVRVCGMTKSGWIVRQYKLDTRQSTDGLIEYEVAA
jgi:hypothetical protein